LGDFCIYTPTQNCPITPSLYQVDWNNKSNYFKIFPARHYSTESLVLAGVAGFCRCHSCGQPEKTQAKITEKIRQIAEFFLSFLILIFFMLIL